MQIRQKQPAGILEKAKVYVLGCSSSMVQLAWLLIQSHWGQLQSKFKQHTTGMAAFKHDLHGFLGMVMRFQCNSMAAHVITNIKTKWLAHKQTHYSAIYKHKHEKFWTIYGLTAARLCIKFMVSTTSNIIRTNMLMGNPVQLKVSK